MADEIKSEINITYEALFELLRREKNREELQKLSLTFYQDVISYLDEKNKILAPESADLFTDKERERTIMQMNNAKKMVKELFERREKKIINMALNSARTQHAIIDRDLFLDIENKFYGEILSIFQKNKQQTLDILTNAKTSVQMESFLKPDLQKFQQTISKPAQKESIKKMIRFILPVPKFIGRQEEVYGPFNPDDVANLSIEIANVLIKKKRAEEINIT